jgi:hypothetical protein
MIFSEKRIPHVGWDIILLITEVFHASSLPTIFFQDKIVCHHKCNGAENSSQDQKDKSRGVLLQKHEGDTAKFKDTRINKPQDSDGMVVLYRIRHLRRLDSRVKSCRRFGIPRNDPNHNENDTNNTPDDKSHDHMTTSPEFPVPKNISCLYFITDTYALKSGFKRWYARGVQTPVFACPEGTPCLKKPK